MGKMILFATVCAAASFTAGCTSEVASVTGTASIAPTTGNTVTGTAMFTGTAGHVSLTVTVTSASPGVHGMHVHQNGACTNDAADAGAHWNGMAAAGDAAGHGLPEGAMHHMGDLGNIMIGADGKGTLTITNAMWTLGGGAVTDVVGHAIVFHTAQDDGMMPSSGARQGCGVVALQ